MNVRFKVDRCSFFEVPHEPTLKYVEHSPFHEDEDHQICCCTKHIKHRPEGTPVSIQQGISIVGELDGRTFEFDLTHNGLMYWWRWPEEMKGKFISKLEDRLDTHAYFWFGGNESCNHLKVEVGCPGRMHVDYLLGNVYFGNDVDISRLMNGHAPSRIVDLKNIPSDQIWVHHCNWGKESIEFMMRNKEYDDLWGAHWAVHRLRHIVSAYSKFDISVDDIRQKVENDPEIIRLADPVINFFSGIISNLDSTEIVRCCNLTELRAEK